VGDNYSFRGGAIGREIQVPHGGKHGGISEAERYQEPVLLVHQLGHPWQANESLMISYCHHQERGK